MSDARRTTSAYAVGDLPKFAELLDEGVPPDDATLSDAFRWAADEIEGLRLKLRLCWDDLTVEQQTRISRTMSRHGR